MLLIPHHSRRGADHLNLSANFLNLLGLLLESGGQGLNLPFLQNNPCLQLLNDLTIFEHLVHCERMARSRDAEFAVRINDNGIAGDWYPAMPPI